jgi:DNA-nicking Smr family endonuclease
MSRRRLTEEEEALWRGYVRSLEPLRRGKATNQARGDRKKPASPPMTQRNTQPKLPTAKTPPLAPLDRRLKQRVARGREPIAARIDLHGMTQQRAHRALLGFLQRAQAEGARIALVVTGKGGGARGDQASERGVLRRQVPVWLELAEFRPFVLGFEDAHVSHGGQGALYVRLRRSR